jgi:hypothetical protein
VGRTKEGYAARLAARASGATRYFTGLPCPRGHIAERQTANATCVECLNEKFKLRATPEWVAAKEAKRRARIQIDPEFAAHRRAQKAAAERARRARADKGIRAAERRGRQAAQLQRTPRWADLSAVRDIYKEAARKTKETGVAHHVDHEIPLCGELVSGLHVAENLRVLPGPENLAKGSKFTT